MPLWRQARLCRLIISKLQTKDVQYLNCNKLMFYKKKKFRLEYLYTSIASVCGKRVSKHTHLCSARWEATLLICEHKIMIQKYLCALKLKLLLRKRLNFALSLIPARVFRVIFYFVTSSLPRILKTLWNHLIFLLCINLLKMRIFSRE